MSVGVLSRLRKRFPPNDDAATRARSKSSKLFEERQRENPAEREHKQKDRQQRVATLGLLFKCFPPSTAHCHVLALDGHELNSSVALLESGHVTHVHVPNYEAGTITALHGKRSLDKRITLYGAAFRDFVKQIRPTDKLVFNCISYDACSKFKTEDMDDVRELSVRRLFPQDRPSLFDTTFCACREDTDNRPLLEYSDQGLDRVQHLYNSMQQFAQETGALYTVTLRFSLINDHYHHKMQSAFFVIVPQGLAATDALHSFFSQLDEVVKHARTTLPPSQRWKKSKKAVMPWHKGQDVEVNFYDWQRYAHANYSKMPCRIIKLLAAGNRATVRPLPNKGVPSVVESATAAFEPSPDFTVPLERLALPPPPMLRLARAFAIGQQIEVAWRYMADEPLSWWAAEVLAIKGARLKIRDRCYAKPYWVDAECCR